MRARPPYIGRIILAHVVSQRVEVALDEVGPVPPAASATKAYHCTTSHTHSFLWSSSRSPLSAPSMSRSRSCRRLPPPSAQHRQEHAFQSRRRSGNENGWLRMSSAYWRSGAGDGEEEEEGSKKGSDHATGTAAIASEFESEARAASASSLSSHGPARALRMRAPPRRPAETRT